jgi:hypothetical protein
MSKKVPVDGLASPPADKVVPALDNGAVERNITPTDGEPVVSRRPLKLSTVSHTLDAEIAERLRHFAFRERISESAVIEFSLRAFFDGGDDSSLGQQLRDRGAGLRRKS